MPQKDVSFYQDLDGTAPVLEWLEELRSSDGKAYTKCIARIERLADVGHELRRPEADFLEDGIYELRAKQGTVNYRLLYFFHGRGAAILAHSLTKEDEIPKIDLKRAKKRRDAFIQNPGKHTYERQASDDENDED